MFRKAPTAPRSVRTLDTIRADALEAERGLHKASKGTLDVFASMLDGAAMDHARMGLSL